MLDWWNGFLGNLAANIVTVPILFWLALRFRERITVASIIMTLRQDYTQGDVFRFRVQVSNLSQFAITDVEVHTDGLLDEEPEVSARRRLADRYASKIEIIGPGKTRFTEWQEQDFERMAAIDISYVDIRGDNHERRIEGAVRSRCKRLAFWRQRSRPRTYDGSAERRF